ncbi:hypothetical protein LTR64_008832 [Lithohypha guttulata]|uniref:uncharacterized protein n=1 Tax=Lithohypha guttulata TaxID=1690604 RepID=UPI002DE0ACF7|nr:hypothetical protein LTR51_008847 [Lithohypha guttulata]
MSSNSTSDNRSHLDDLVGVLKQLSEQSCIHELQRLLKRVETLRTKVSEYEAIIKSQETTMMAKSDEVIRLKKEHKDRQEEIIEFHASLLRKKDDEKSALNQAFTRQEGELNEARTSVQNLQQHTQTLQEQIKGQDAEVKKIESSLRQARSDIDRLNRSLKDQKEQAKSKEQQWQAEKKAHGQFKSQAEALNIRIADLEAELKVSNQKLGMVDELAPPLLEDDTVEVSRNFQKIWKQCFLLSQACFQDDNPPEQLNSSIMWRNLRASNVVTYAVPLAPTNSPPARRMRFSTTLAVLTNSLIRRLFTSTYILRNTEEIDKLTLEVADNDQRREAFLRRVLNSVSEDVEDQLLEERVNLVEDEVVRCIEPLLSAEQSRKLKNDLPDVLRLAASLWKSLRKRQSYFTIEPRPPSQTTTAWKSLVWNEGKRGFSEEDINAPTDVVFILFPRVVAIGHEGEQEVFPGVVLLKSETAAAHAELSELPPADPTLVRTGTHRSVGGRRGTVDQKSRLGSFLVQNGSQKPSG